MQDLETEATWACGGILLAFTATASLGNSVVECQQRQVSCCRPVFCHHQCLQLLLPAWVLCALSAANPLTAGSSRGWSAHFPHSVQAGSLASKGHRLEPSSAPSLSCSGLRSPMQQQHISAASTSWISWQDTVDEGTGDEAADCSTWHDPAGSDCGRASAAGQDFSSSAMPRSSEDDDGRLHQLGLANAWQRVAHPQSCHVVSLRCFEYGTCGLWVCLSCELPESIGWQS